MANRFLRQLASYRLPTLTPLKEPPQWLQQAITACTSGNGLRAGTTGLALAARKSPSQLRRVIRDCYGCSATELMTQLRLDRARYLLTHTDQRLNDIATALGWRSEAWFSELFAHHHQGLRPGQWRQQERNPQNKKQN